MWNNSDKNANNKKIIEAYRYLFVWIGFAREKGTWIEIFQGSWGTQGQEIIMLCKQERGLLNLLGPMALCLNSLKNWTREVKTWLQPRTQLASEFRSLLEFEVKWALEIITTNKICGGDGTPVELFQILKMMLWECCTQYASKFKNSAVATGLEKVSFHSNPKERQCQRIFKLLHNCTHLTR